MFKGILPKRISSSEFTMVTPLGDSYALNGQETAPTRPPSVAQTKSSTAKSSKGGMFSDKSKRKKGEGSPTPDGVYTEQAFGRLLDDLQIPSTLRPKLIGMDSSVKAAMLKGSQVILPGANSTPPSTSRGLRRVQSGSSLSIESPRPQRVAPSQYQSSHKAYSPPKTAGGTTGSQHPRGASIDIPRPKSRAQGNTVFLDNAAPSRSLKEKASMRNFSPVQFVSVLTSTSSVELDVEVVKKLRIFLRNESASWTQDFLKAGGYSALLTRLNELLEVEWREEQHDDQLLHELLRSLKGLSTSAIGCFALRSSCPIPFIQLVSLLYSDKKPGEVATRQLIVDLLLILFELYPPSSLPSTGGAIHRREAWDSPTTAPRNIITLPYPHQSVYTLLRTLLLTPAPPSAEAPETPLSPHEFIDKLHKPRIFKTYLQELSDVCRDYFWVFCHPNNTIWNLADTDEAKVEKPRAPGGMTGGVEFEAMTYLTTHFKLLNCIAKAALDLNLSKDNEFSAHQLHVDLFLSGIERILLVARKASTAYYPTLQLEIARYVALAGEAHFELPWTVSRLIGAPPSAHMKHSARPKNTSSARNSPQSSPTKRSGAGPMLPSPRRTEPLKFD